MRAGREVSTASTAESLEEQSRSLVRAVAMFQLDAGGRTLGSAMPKSVPDNVARLPERPVRPGGVPSRTVMPKVKRASGAANEVDDEWEEF